MGAPGRFSITWMKPNTPDGKRPGSAKRSKTRDLIVHENVPLPLTPRGWRTHDAKLKRMTYATGVGTFCVIDAKDWSAKV